MLSWLPARGLRPMRGYRKARQLRISPVCAALLMACLLSVSAAAQDQARDYGITTPLVSYSAGDLATIRFDIQNNGGDALAESSITIAQNSSGIIERSVSLPILAAGESYSFSTDLPLGALPEGDVFMRVEVGVDQYELAGSPIARDNIGLFMVNRADARNMAGSVNAGSAAAGNDVVIPLLNLGLSLRAEGIQINDGLIPFGHILLLIALLAIALFLVWIMSLILRLVLRRPPAFEPWQPPYAINAFYDPESTRGRRQSWQFHARSSAILAPCQPNHVEVIKRLVDARGKALGSWEVKAARAGQYDIYGRISRSEVIMPQKIIKRLNALAAGPSQLDGEALSMALQPIAEGISKVAIAAIEKQNRSLPIALDLRFEGAQGEARIEFELYQCSGGAWRMIDRWQPELGGTGSRIPENFSYALNGMLPGESFREFKARLPRDLRELLLGMLTQPSGAAEPDPPTPAPAASENQMPEVAADPPVSETPIPEAE